MESGTVLALAELSRVHELATELRTHLHQPPQLGLCRALAQEMLSSVEKAIHAAKSAALPCGGDESPPNDEHLKMTKKRKMDPKWTSHVRASGMTGGGSEGPPEDGHSWRKYGQKDILGAKHPRAYYRCTHRKTRGCPAMKQVQRSDHSPWLFHITYRGTHTCVDQTVPKPCLGAQSGLGSMTERCDLEAPEANSSLVSLSTQVNTEDGLFCSSKSLDGCFLGCFSSTFTSPPTTSGSNHLPWSPFQNSNGGTPEADLADIISAATSASLMDVKYTMQAGEMGTDIPFDTSIFFEWNSVS